MQTLHAGQVRSKDGVCGTVVPASLPVPSDASQVLVQFESGRRMLVPSDMLRPQADGSYVLPLTLAELERVGSTEAPHHEDTLVVPVLTEELAVQKRVVETGKVRITKVVHEREAVVDEPLIYEQVEIERVPIQRVVDAPIPVRYEQDTVIVSILEEVLVVEKRFMLKEELHIRTRRVETHQPQQVTLRCEEVRIERLHNGENDRREL